MSTETVRRILEISVKYPQQAQVYPLTSSINGDGSTLGSEPALRCVATILSRVRAPPRAPCPDGKPYKPETTLLWPGYIQPSKHATNLP
ncbi:hypothetical protein PoB_004852300 [Plakobranchus ocellatus]|uniref:Uncharacterized protein n=1 Tax=Plakobranchus ocellatus TaxID=259542 RepID=A0AAV4BTA6_9GAST|nr:hypothetical protein PoB_004852300 [Plakobranchus ocellatus]